MVIIYRQYCFSLVGPHQCSTLKSDITYSPPPLQAELESQREEGLESVRRALADYRASLNVNCVQVQRAKYAEYNSRQQPVSRESDELSLTDLSGNPNFVIGNEVSPHSLLTG